MPSTISAGTTAGTAIAVAGDTTGNLAFQTNGTTTAMTIDTSQRVGIGTAPRSWTSGVSVIDFGASGAILSSATGAGVVDLYYNNFFNGSNSIYKATGSASYYRQLDGNHIWYNAPSGTAGNTISFTERMSINSVGDVLIGTNTFPGSGLTNGVAYVFGVGTDQRASFNANNGNNVMNINQTFPDTVSRGQIYFYRQSTFVGSITSTNSATAYNTSSDYRLKENIAPMTGALAKVTQLKPCTYKWKVDGSDGQGFIAHELAETCPDAVSGEKDAVNEDGSIKPQGIDTSFLVATLTAAIQELNAKVEAQAAEIAALKGA
jgi:hypothetical protein